MTSKNNTTKPKFKKCKTCANKFQVFRSTQQVCSTPCAIELGKINAAKKIKDERKADKKAVRDLNRKDVRWQHKRTQIAFNRMRVLEELKWFADRGLEPLCNSCRKPKGNDIWCNGHFKTVGSNGRLRYDPKNSYLQHNFNCNMSQSGDIKNYELGLADRFGEEKAAEIIDYCETNNAPIKRTWQELEAMRKEINQRIRELENEL
jgi:hypothetical protein